MEGTQKGGNTGSIIYPYPRKDLRGQQKPRSLSSSVISLCQERPCVGPSACRSAAQAPVTDIKHLLLIVSPLSTLFSLVDILGFFFFFLWKQDFGGQVALMCI